MSVSPQSRSASPSTNGVSTWAAAHKREGCGVGHSVEPTGQPHVYIKNTVTLSFASVALGIKPEPTESLPGHSWRNTPCISGGCLVTPTAD